MKDLPFSLYDFLVSFGSGAALLGVINFAYRLQWFTVTDPGAFSVAGWTIAAYTAGHIVAQLSGWLVEHLVVERLLRRTEASIFVGGAGWRRQLFPRLFVQLPAETQHRILVRAPAGLREPGMALFNHCFAIVKRDPVAFARMNTFQTLYGFARNISFVAGLAVVIYIVQAMRWLLHDGAIPLRTESALASTTFVAVVMFYRYLNFYWRYSFELYVTYAEGAEIAAEVAVTVSETSRALSP